MLLQQVGTVGYCTDYCRHFSCRSPFPPVRLVTLFFPSPSSSLSHAHFDFVQNQSCCRLDALLVASSRRLSSPTSSQLSDWDASETVDHTSSVGSPGTQSGQCGAWPSTCSVIKERTARQVAVTPYRCVFVQQRNANVRLQQEHSLARLAMHAVLASRRHRLQYCTEVRVRKYGSLPRLPTLR